MTSRIILSSQDIVPRKSYQGFAAIFDAHNIRYVRIQWVDLNNQVRARVLPVPYFRTLLESERPGVSVARAALAIVVLEVAPGFSPVGEMLYAIDFSSFRICSYAPGHAVFFGFFQEHVPVPRLKEPSFETPTNCPRTVLSRLVRYAQQELGIQSLVGVETEFVLLKSTNPIVPVNEYEYSTTLGLSTGMVETQVLEEIADALQADGINLQMYHTEAAPGQYEIVTGPMPPLEAADALVHTRETIYNIARKHGLKATFAPRLASDSCGTGAHTHVSVRRGDGPGVSGSELMTPVESAFLAGLMNHLPSVIAFTLPLAASYARMVDGIWSGGTWVCWGAENREAPVRLTKAYSPSRNFEIKQVDGTSNPYLAIAGILACGVLGVRDNLILGVKNCDGPRSAAKMTDAEKAAMGITKRLPLNLAEARQYLAADDEIKGLLGSGLVELFVQLNEMLQKSMGRREGESEAQALNRLIEGY